MTSSLSQRLTSSLSDARTKVRHKFHHKVHKNARHVTHALAYHLETLYICGLVFIASLAFLGNSMFADITSKLQPNDHISYPLNQVSTYECRAQMVSWAELPDSCKVPLPIIRNAHYAAYENNTDYKNIYTVLWGATYPGQWDMDKGDHAGVDIATANGTPLYAVAHGVVTFAGTQAGYGKVVKLMFRYQGVTYHAVYAHMSEISVSKGDTVTQGQKIGEVGNTGATYGALGGYHVHFEINKDAGGKPAFYYQGCPALKTHTFTQITNGGLCREYRQQYSYDPIAFIELSQRGQPIPATKPAHQAAPVEPVAPIAPAIDTTPITQGVANPQIPTPTTITNPTPNTASGYPLILKSVPVARLSHEAMLFLQEWDIAIQSTTSDVVRTGESGQLVFTITKKGSSQTFDGVLPVPFTLLSVDGGMSVSENAFQYVQNGTYRVAYQTHYAGRGTIVISIDGQTIATYAPLIQ